MMLPSYPRVVYVLPARSRGGAQIVGRVVVVSTHPTRAGYSTTEGGGPQALDLTAAKASTGGMSGYESPRPEDEVAPDVDARDLTGEDRPVDDAAARAHGEQPDDDKPVLNPDASVDPIPEANP